MKDTEPLKCDWCGAVPVVTIVYVTMNGPQIPLCVQCQRKFNERKDAENKK